MHCPRCTESTLCQYAAEQGTLVDVCSKCHGLWLDGGEILEFSSQPRDLEQQLDQGLRDQQPSDRMCPRCHCGLEAGHLPDRDVRVDRCANCRGFWFDADAVAQISGSANSSLQLPAELTAQVDAEAREAAHQRLRDVAAALIALPNLFLRSILTLALLYSLVILLLITLVQLSYLGPSVALAIGVGFALVQFTLGPWIMDFCLRWLYAFHWVRPEQLPDHLRTFVERVCAEHGLRFPSFGLIEDGAPAAFTYGHHPRNARVVISQGLLNLLEPDEVEAVVAHELGHARNWDMVLMTVANLAPLLLFFLYRVAIDRGRKNQYGWAAAIGAYVLYIVSTYIVLWFSRTREYFADRFAGTATGNPNALARALVKIAYGLAAQPGVAAGDSKEEKKQKEKEEKRKANRVAALGALNIFDQKAAVGLVMAASAESSGGPAQLDVEQVKGAMQWDLWNPWALYYELHSTHPLVAKRLQHLTDQAAHQGQEPQFVFDRRKPESYWDEFFVDFFMLILPWLCFLLGVGVAVTVGNFLGLAMGLAVLAAGLALAGVGSILKTNFVYRRDFFPHLSVVALLHKVKVSAVRPVPAVLTGTIIGKGVPGLVWSEDFVLRDRTGIIFLDYRQPFAIWDFFFGLLRAGRYQGKDVRVTGWYRRSPVPYLEVNRIEVLDGSLPARRCYSYHARLAVGFLLAAVGVAAAVGLLLM
jgi:Zn-dependent protease with chaperone function